MFVINFFIESDDYCEYFSQHSDVGNIQDVIATLEYDIQAVKKKIHMEEIQGMSTSV